jgi:hypothetical protein
MEKFVPTRRQFLYAAGLAVGGTVAGLTFETTAQAQQAVRVRPNIADLSEGSRALQALRDGVAAMKKLTQTSPRDPRGWKQQANIHLNFCPHSNWFFLPWHRAYLHYFEMICRDASGWSDFTLPYWDWTTSPAIPAQFWGNGNPLYDANRDARFAQNQNAQADPKWISARVIKKILGNSDFVTFGSAAAIHQRDSAGTGELEGTPHNNMHNWIGGTTAQHTDGDMGTFLSPLDPIFWLHHANVDRLWTEWSRLHPAGTPADQGWQGFPLQHFYDLQQKKWVTVHVKDTFSTYAYGYRYPSQPPSPPPSNLRLAQSLVVRTVAPARRTESAVQRRASTSAPAQIELSVPAQVRQRFSALRTMEEAETRTTTLRLSVTIAFDEYRETNVSVFINPQGDARSLTPDDPGYVGTVALFHDPAMQMGTHKDAPTQTFIFDVSDEIARLAHVNASDAQAGRVRVVVVPEPLDRARRTEVKVTTKLVRLEAVA